MKKVRGNSAARRTAASSGKIVLFRGRPTTGERLPTFLPLGLMAIAAPLDLEGYEFVIVDAGVDRDFKKLILENVEGAVCFGVSSMTGYQIKEGLEAAEAVRKTHPEVPIVWGGFHPSILPEQTVSHPLVDIVVVGQGERTFPELVHALQAKRSLKGIKGLVYKDRRTGRIITNDPRPFEDLGNFPSYAFHLVDMDRYLFESEYADRTANYVSSYGCPHRCAFCAEQKMFKRRWIARKPKQVVDDLEKLVRDYGVNGVYLQDSNFFTDIGRAKEIFKEIIGRGLKFRWNKANGRTETLARMDDETWRLMKESGCYDILVGAESGSQEVLDFIDKDNSVVNSYIVAEKAAKYGIKVFWSLMLGFPPGKKFKVPIEEEFDKTLDMIIRINRISKNHKILWFLLTPYPETPLAEQCMARGFRGYDSLDGWARHDFIKDLDTLVSSPWIPPKYVPLIDQLDMFVFPYASSLYMKMTYAAGKGRFKYLSPFFPAVAALFHVTATLRLNHKFFAFPVEYKVIKTLLKVPVGIESRT